MEDSFAAQLRQLKNYLVAHLLRSKTCFEGNNDCLPTYVCNIHAIASQCHSRKLRKQGETQPCPSRLPTRSTVTNRDAFTRP